MSMSCRDICLHPKNIRHEHLPTSNKHLRQGQTQPKRWDAAAILDTRSQLDSAKSDSMVLIGTDIW